MYIVSKFAIAMISPLGASLFLGVLTLLLALGHRARLSVFFGVLAVGWLGVWSLPVASDWLRGTLESQFPALEMPDVPEVEAIVVLGGGVTPPSVGAVVPNLEAGADRVWFGAQLFHAGKAPLVVLRPLLSIAAVTGATNAFKMIDGLAAGLSCALLPCMMAS